MATPPTTKSAVYLPTDIHRLSVWRPLVQSLRQDFPLSTSLQPLTKKILIILALPPMMHGCDSLMLSLLIRRIAKFMFFGRPLRPTTKELRPKDWPSSTMGPSSSFSSGVDGTFRDRSFCSVSTARFPPKRHVDLPGKLFRNRSGQGQQVSFSR